MSAAAPRCNRTDTEASRCGGVVCGNSRPGRRGMENNAWATSAAARRRRDANRRLGETVAASCPDSAGEIWVGARTVDRAIGVEPPQSLRLIEEIAGRLSLLGTGLQDARAHDAQI